MPGNLSTYAGGGSRWITNPKHLNALAIVQTQLYAKVSRLSSQGAGVAAFFTGLARRGAQTSIAVADTYVTLLDITSGSGFAFNFVSPTHTAAFVPTIRITVDGVVYTIAPSASIALNNRLVLGPVINGVSVSTIGGAAISGDIPGPSSAGDVGFRDAAVGGVAVVDGSASDMSIPLPGDVLTYGLQSLRFETSLKVEMKASLLSANAVDRQCAVTHRLDL